MFVVCSPNSHDVPTAGVLIDTGATTHVAGALWGARLAHLPGVKISGRTVGEGVSAGLGRGTPELHFREGASPARLAHGRRRRRALRPPI